MRLALTVLNTALMIVYPLAVYWGLTRYGARGVGLVVLVGLLPTVWAKLAAARGEDRWAVLRVPLSVAALVGLGALLDDARFAKALPVLINVALLASFGGSLRHTPMVERFARMTSPTLTEAQRAYCRRVTQVWCGFFAVNASVTAALALFAPTSWWAIYTGGVAYAVMGTLGGVEYVVRKARFREYGTGLHDRLLSRVFPPPAMVDGGKP